LSFFDGGDSTHGSVNIQPVIDALKIDPRNWYPGGGKTREGKEIFTDRPPGQEGQPIVTLPMPTANTPTAGIIRGVMGTASGLTTPENLLLLASLQGAPPAIARAVAAGFSVQMAKDTAEKVAAANQATEPGQKAELYTQAVLSGVMAGLSMKHAAGGRPVTGGALPEERAGGVTPEQADTIS